MAEAPKLSCIQAMTAAFQLCADSITADGEISTEMWLKGCESVSDIYDVLFGAGWISGLLKGDIQNSAKTIRGIYAKDPEANSTLQKLIDNELSKKSLKEIAKDKVSASIGFLWSYRATFFLVRFLVQMHENKVDATKISSLTYEEVLKPFHGMATRMVVGNVMKMTPDRPTLLGRFGLTEEAAKVELAAFCDLMVPLFEKVFNVITSKEINFPDKV